MFMPQLEFRPPANFVCRKFVEESDISSKIFLRKSSAKTILKDLAVRDVIVCEKSLRGKVLREPKGSERQVQAYN